MHSVSAPADTFVVSRLASHALDAQRSELAEAVVAEQYARQPELAQRYGAAGRAKCLTDVNDHLAYLSQALAAGEPALFADYIGWAKVMLARRNVPADDLARHLELLRDNVRARLASPAGEAASSFVDAGLSRLPQMPADLPSFLPGEGELAGLAREYQAALLCGERQQACQLVLDAAERGVSVRDIYLRVFQPCQYEIGRLWQTNQVSVAQEHYCTAVTQLVMAQLYPRIFAGAKTAGSLVTTCVAGELHEIGARMVTDFFEMDGWNTYYLGANMSDAGILQTVRERKATVLCISVTITYHVRLVESLITAVRRDSSMSGVIVLVGGYPFKIAPSLWKNIGADGCANDAQEAIATVSRLQVGKDKP